MGIDFSTIAPNTQKERDGVWRMWTNGVHSIEFRLARAGGSNTSFRVRAEELTRVYRRSNVDLLMLPTDKQDALNRELYADTIVKGWRSDAFEGLNDENFSRSDLIQLFTLVPETLVFCITEATASSNYANAVLEAEAGNSSPS